MAFKGVIENKSQLVDIVRPGKRLFLNKTQDRLVGPDDPSAAYLFCTETDDVPRDQYEQLMSIKPAPDETQKAGVTVQPETKRRRGRPRKQ